jgi:hypothetical protein
VELPRRGFVIEVVRKLQALHTFVSLPRRWDVERSVGWMIAYHHLMRDYEEGIDVPKQMMHVVMSSLLLKRLFDAIWFKTGSKLYLVGGMPREKSMMSRVAR